MRRVGRGCGEDEERKGIWRTKQMGRGAKYYKLEGTGAYGPLLLRPPDMWGKFILIINEKKNQGKSIDI